MKKIFLAAIFLTTLSSFAQTQIPNGGFENWSPSTYCSEMDSLDHFLSSEALMYLRTKKALGSASCPSQPFQYQSTDKYTGNYALTLGPRYYLFDEPFNNFINLGKITLSDNLMDTDAEGVPFTGRPTKLTGYYKYTGGVSTDELKIEVLGANINNNAEYLFFGIFTTSVNQTSYKKFEIDLNYDPTDPSNPTLLILLITVGNSDDGSINENTVAFIDDLIFEYDTPTSTVTNTSASPINVYATNKNINFSENVSDVHVVDMVGAQKMQEASTTKTLNATSLTTGMYIVTYKYNDAYFSKKVVIE